MGANQEMFFNSPFSTLLFHFSHYGFSLTPLPGGGASVKPGAKIAKKIKKMPKDNSTN
jgi:hypothetical protein